MYFLPLPFLVHKIFTFYINGVLHCKCPTPGPKGKQCTLNGGSSWPNSQDGDALTIRDINGVLLGSMQRQDIELFWIRYSSSVSLTWSLSCCPIHSGPEKGCLGNFQPQPRAGPYPFFSFRFIVFMFSFLIRVHRPGNILLTSTLKMEAQSSWVTMI